jgi:uncharacterized SAM-binding protein YcdF (DUF218 family)
MIELLKLLAMPVVWIFALMVLGLLLTGRLPKKRRYQLGRCALFLGMCILFLLSTKPLSELLLYSLERQYPVPSDEMLSTLDIMAVLGGGMYTSGGFRQYPELSGIAYSRLFNGVRIFKRSGAKTLALSGGSSQEALKAEADVMKALALELGVPESRIVTETKSRNTMENGAELAKLFSSAQAKRIGLVTSALHMPRSVKVFRKQFPDAMIVPIPVNHFYSPDWGNLRSYIPSPDTLAKSNYAIHEWIGMMWYVIRY